MRLEVTGWKSDGLPRFLAGVNVGQRTGRIKAVVLQGFGEGWDFRWTEADSVTYPPPESNVPLVDALEGAIRETLERAEVPIASLEVLGLESENLEHAELLAAMLASRLGVTVLTSFAAGDRAEGGRGRPLGCIPEWILFRSARVSRLLVHVGSVLEVVYLPAQAVPTSLIAFDAGPCGAFLDGLVELLSQGRLTFDPGGHFAVQGRQSDALIGHWMSHPYILKTPPKSLDPLIDFGPDLRLSSLAFARENQLSARDILCSANVFVARVLVDAVERFVAKQAIDEVWVTGGGSWNGMLWKQLQEGFSPLPVARGDDLGIPSEARRALHAAMLAYCTMENLPANLPACTGARQSVLLGQITPGSGPGWQRFLENCLESLPETRRDAA